MQKSSSSETDTAHALTITRDGLPLILLAAQHHPDAELRAHLSARLDALISSRQPFVSSGEARRLLASCHCSRADPLDLLDEDLTLAVQVVRLVFARQTRLHHKHRLFIVDPDDKRHALVLCAPGRVEPLARTRGGSQKRHRFHTRLDVGGLGERLVMFRERVSPFRVTCKYEAGVTLEIRGPTGWRVPPGRGSLLEQGSLASGPTLVELGLVGECVPEGIRITTPTPESILRFSAALARGDILRIKLGPRSPTATYLFIRLRDFEEAEADLPVAVFPGDLDEEWLTGLPSVEMSLPLDEVLSVVQWAYPRDEWLVLELRERLV
jgi:hypothetical protein